MNTTMISQVVFFKRILQCKSVFNLHVTKNLTGVTLLNDWQHKTKVNFHESFVSCVVEIAP